MILPVLLSGCASVAPAPFERTAYPNQNIPVEQTVVRTGSIFDNGNRLYPTRRAYQSGDIKVGHLITVVLDETTQASRSGNVTTSRASSNDVLGVNQVGAMVPGGAFFQDLNLSGANISSEGIGTAGQENSLSGSIAAVVVQVFPNGNLLIEGDKMLTLTEGSEYIKLSGVIRAVDVQPDNTILSRRIANAQISYSGTGDLVAASKPGWLTRALYEVWPF
ncbi:flagellar basal body L-ring protein FlgH [Pseudomonadales bacterium]|nr:flagellar basal body L-ring protein FlgH [Pseudomonadales bacterium]MDB9867971.1 flagellar basal body L-ring protein FlgH [Pseudomonadales bacterium]MDB9942990.1 flagellar basal body L-ring protein FlgH [Pseudomonadales bacterium]MDC0013466.1 flagellar basal body L-ring protein FlgH [Pseudomonadales bacterium]MDC1307188.1 flagellar basal body L-ring protein FlgH [Pseudomonadales bacterium]